MAFYSDFAGHYEKIFPFREGTLRFLDQWLPDRGRLLDVGCGSGGYCHALDRGERSCLGIDLDPGMIAAAEESWPESRFRIMGMEEIGLLGQNGFSGAFCIGNVLPHLPSDSLADFILNIKGLLVPGGIWIFQTVNFDPLLSGEEDEYHFPDIWSDDQQLLFQRWYEDIAGGALTFRTRLIADNQELFLAETRLAPKHSLEYRQGHEAAGFELLGHYSDFVGNAFEPTRVGGSIFVMKRI